MAEATMFMFSFHEITEALIKKQGLHEGIWGITVQFGIEGTNTAPSPEELFPTALVPVMKIGIRQFDSLTPLSLDAAKVNPKPTNDSSEISPPSEQSQPAASAS